TGDSCWGEVLRGDGLSTSAGAPPGSPCTGEVCSILRRFAEEAALRVIQVSEEVGEQFARLAAAESQADADEIMARFAGDSGTRRFHRRAIELADGSWRQLADVAGARCGDEARHEVLATFAQAVASRTCHTTWLESEGRRRIDALALDEPTRERTTEILNRFGVELRKARADFALKAMSIRSDLTAFSPNERAAAGIHKAARREVWRPHETAIADLKRVLDAESVAVLERAIAKATLENPLEFGDSTTDLDEVDR
ncbi:MAG: hypothetical protein JNL80_05495, partial [Phycisphaerae bacterium]|nr:hypothetical protein [Phycisphaerae bacterium]